MGIGGGRSIEPMSASLRPNILYKEKAKYTEDARTNKITGTVVLNLVFSASGSITDIAVYRPSDGTWYVLRSRDGFIAQQWGFSTDLPVPAAARP